MDRPLSASCNEVQVIPCQLEHQQTGKSSLPQLELLQQASLDSTGNSSLVHAQSIIGTVAVQVPFGLLLPGCPVCAAADHAARAGRADGPGGGLPRERRPRRRGP